MAPSFLSTNDLNYLFFDYAHLPRCRRYCRVCKKQYTADIPGVPRYARFSANQSAMAAALHMNGFSHGKTATFFGDALKSNKSRSWSYRHKINTAKRLKPKYEEIKANIILELCLKCDETWWRKAGSNSCKIMVMCGEENCLAEVVDSATIEKAKEFLEKYGGTIVQDSNPIWLHVGSDHQFCIPHQRRLSKKDLKHRNLKGDPLTFLKELEHLDYLPHVYDKIDDAHVRQVAARCMEKNRSELLNGQYTDDKDGTIARRKKRHFREGWFMTTHMYKDEVPPDNNGVERVNRQFSAVRGDGGGNRTEKGMKANSILFTVMATCWINR